MNYKDTAGTPRTSTAIRATTGSDARNSRDPYNSWDPRKAIGSNNIGHSRARSNSRIFMDYGTLTKVGMFAALGVVTSYTNNSSVAKTLPIGRFQKCRLSLKNKD
jgi:hypothetical protein